MAGRPRERAMIAELQRRASAEFGEGAEPMDAVRDYVQNGGTLAELADELTETLRLKVSRSMIYKYTNQSDERKKAMAEARAEGAGAMVDNAVKILDESDKDRDALNKNKARADIRLKTAAFWNRSEYGQQQAQGVQINIGSLHLMAHRERLAGAKQAALSSGDVVDAEVELITGGTEETEHGTQV